MPLVGKLKFKDQDLYMHYTELDGDFWFITDSNDEKNEFFDTFEGFEFLYELKSDEYKAVSLSVNSDLEFTENMFNQMLADNNSYFKEFKDTFVAVKLENK
jgi:hypothetical protein